MTPDELRALMARADDITQKALAQALGVHKMTVWRWLNGRTPIDAANAALIRQTIKHKKK